MSLFDIINKVKKEVEKLASEALNGDKPVSAPEEAQPAAAPVQDEWGEGDTWYDHVPAEECQYNSGMNYLDYFEKIYREDFPGYDITREDAQPFRRYVYTFYKEGAVKLVVELMTENSSVNRTRTACLKAGTPYLRFYFDHDGWWNTRKYVTERIGEKLGA